MKKIFVNIKGLLQVLDNSDKLIIGNRMKELSKIDNAFLLIEDGIIIDYGPMENCPSLNSIEKVDSKNRYLLPAWCDSHSHIVYSGNREKEFVQRISGESYQTIAKNGGGILNSSNILRETSFEELYNQSSKRIEEVIKLGTGAIEIKSGYGLEIEAEIKMLEVIKQLNENYDISIKSTFLAAHAVPKEYQNNKDEYIKKIIDEWIPRVAKEKLASYIDVFCEKGYFSKEDTETIVKKNIFQFNKLEEFWSVV